MIRVYQSDDFAAVCHIFADGKRDEFQHEPIAASNSQLVGSERDRFLQADSFVYLHLNQVVGFITVSHRVIMWLYVAPAFRGQGIGLALLKYAVHQFTNQTLKPQNASSQSENALPDLHLYCVKSNHSAMQFYLRHGLELVMEFDELIQDYPVTICKFRVLQTDPHVGESLALKLE